MNKDELKKKIKIVIQSFASQEYFKSADNLLKVIGYDSSHRLPLREKNSREFINAYDIEGKLNHQKAYVNKWLGIDLLFQLTGEDLGLGAQPNLPIPQKERIDQNITSYLFFVLDLEDEHYNRTNLSNITREINKLFLIPVMLVIKHGENLSIAIINRRPNKREPEKDVLEKVTLIKDIDIQNPHRAHIDILYDLSYSQISAKHAIQDMEALHEAWQTVLDTKELNKKFYKELSYWYFWAVKECTFPIEAGDDKTRNPTSVIRLITRLIFIWFIKEKGLMPDELFNEAHLTNVLKSLTDYETTYYKAILQNLFFATLNQEDLQKRRFIDDNSYQGKNKQYGVLNIYRYKNLFTQPEVALDLFKDIPFLNGGLFECLDREREESETIPAGCEPEIRRIDGFSQNKSNILSVPNELFFGQERQVDLNTIFGTKNKRYKVRGLINILQSYKFTIEENTPLEEEVALDPELLGRVFENLLAAYNPETQTTARKATGSYYTPREIVNYMVDESLITYLDQKLMDFNPNPEKHALVSTQPALSGQNQPGLPSEIRDESNVSPYEQRLRRLFDYGEQDNPFSQKETDVLIDAIGNVKVLDPACGSGAFPMGILHRLVFLLGKLDQHNQRWKERQLKNVSQIEDPQARETAVKAIEEAFETNELDYGRKLYLIQNCIYGVDIQPIAVQIAKLRFFISLVVDQKVDDSKPNRGVSSLPNLESKFVAANSLIGIEKPDQMALGDNNIEEIQKKLFMVRENHFNAHTRAQKIACRKKDRELRKKLAEELQKNNWSTTSAQQVATWDPYAQNVSADFFDPKWTFGIKNGFDVIIGNPPYLESRNAAFQAKLKDSYQAATKFRWADEGKLVTRGSDLLIYFFEFSIYNIRQKGIVSLITQNAWLDTVYGKKFQKFLLRNASVFGIVDSDYRYFPSGEGPNVNTVITFIGRKNSNKLKEITFSRYHESFNNLITSNFAINLNQDINVVNQHSYKYDDPLLFKLKWGILLGATDQVLLLLKKMNSLYVTLGKIKNTSLSYGQGLNLSKDYLVDKKQIGLLGLSLESCIPFLTTEDGALFEIIDTSKKIIDKSKLSTAQIKLINSKNIQLFNPKRTRKIFPILIMPRGIGKHYCALNSINCYSSSGVDVYDNSGDVKEDIVLNLWLFFNSSIAWLLREISGRKNLGGGMLKAEAIDLESIPVYYDFKQTQEIKQIFKIVHSRKVISSIEEINTPEHQKIDSIVFNSLGLSNDESKNIKEELIQIITTRNKKSST